MHGFVAPDSGHLRNTGSPNHAGLPCIGALYSSVF